MCMYIYIDNGSQLFDSMAGEQQFTGLNLPNRPPQPGSLPRAPKPRGFHLLMAPWPGGMVGA